MKSLLEGMRICNILSIVLEYQNAQSEIQIKENLSRIVESKASLCSNETERDNVIDFSRMRSRNSCIRKEVLSDLTDIGVVLRKSNFLNVGSPPRLDKIYRGESRPASPVSPYTPTSPRSMKKKSVMLGFRLNSITLVLKRALEKSNAVNCRDFLHRLRKINNRLTALRILADLLTRKLLNKKFHTFSILVTDVNTKATTLQEVVNIPSVLPLGAVHPLAKLPPYLHYKGSQQHKYAALGKIVGVMMSISRIYKSVFFNRLKKKKLSKLRLLIDK